MQATPQTPRFSFKDEWLPLLFILACWGLAAWYWPQLPERVPTHWGIDGQPNEWMDKPWGVIIGPAVATLIYALLVAIPYLDPRKRNWMITLRIYPVFKNSMAALLLLTTYLALSAAASPEHHMNRRVLVIAVGLFFMILGNYLPKVRSNFFVGVRTPWTLSSEAVWEQTHRVVGRLFVLGGAASAASAFLPAFLSFFVVIGILVGLAVFSLVYSWWLFQRLPEPPTRLE